MDESGINLNFDLDESDQERILEIVKSDLVDSVLSELPASDFPNFDFYELRSKTVPLSTSLNESPTLKNEVVRSRTQLKQQLMRDQELMKEQERRRIAEEETAIAAESLQEPIPIPLNVSSVQLPEHVLQVRSALQHPTRYHILAKQKNQVMQFLSSSEPEDFVSKFDAQKATLHLKQQQQQIQLQISQRQQIQDQQKQQMYQQRQFQQQQRILQRRQVQKRRQLQLQYQEQWHKNKLEQMQNMEHEEKLEQMQLMEHEQLMHQKRQQRQLYYFQQQQREEELELQQQLQAQHQLEQQQLLHQHQMEKQQLQQQFQMEKQQLHQQQEQLKLHQQLLKHQRQKQLQKQAIAEDKAAGEALVQAQAEIRARIKGLLYGQPSPEVEGENPEQQKPSTAEAETGTLQQAQVMEQAQAMEQVQAMDQAQAMEQAQAIEQVQAIEQAQAMEQVQAMEQIQAIEQVQAMEQAQAVEQVQAGEQAQVQVPSLGQSEVQKPEQMQDEACALPLDSPNSTRGKRLHRLISDLTKDVSLTDEKYVQDMFTYDVCFTMPGNLCGSSGWGRGEPDSLPHGDVLNIKCISCPSELEHYDQELSPCALHHAKSRIRKDNHNIVEKRRRSNINDRIKELADLLPKVNEPYYDVVRDGKNNKGGILKSSVQYMKCLKYEIDNLRQLEINNRILQQEVKSLVLKLREMELKENEREREMLTRCPGWMIVRPHAFSVSILKDESDKNNGSKNGSNESNKSDTSSSQCDLMDEDTDKDEIC